MVGILVISHGMLCEGIIDSVGMLTGKIEQLETVSLKPGMTPETYQNMVRDAVECVDNGDGVLVLVDLMGGTPFNTIALLSKELNVQILTGVNMAMLATLALERTEGDTLDDLAKKAEEAAHNGIRILKR